MKTILITGAAGGLGSYTAAYLAGQGYRVYAADIARVQTAPPHVHPIVMDVTDMQSVQAAFSIVSANADRLDGILHLAGIYRMDSLIEVSEEQYLRMFQVNCLGVYRVNKVFFPLLRTQAKPNQTNGRIVVVSSELAFQKPLPFNGMYSITKTALDSYAQSLRLELALLDIPVILFRPGAFHTALLDTAMRSMRRMCEETQLYPGHARKFYAIMHHETSGARPPIVLARALQKALEAKTPKPIYRIHTSFALAFYSRLPMRVQKWAIKLLLKPR